MPTIESTIYLSTMLLERNRSNGKGPSLLVSDWAEPISEVGYAGVEIWMNHLLLASRSEWELIRERALEFDLAVAAIATPVPADQSDKSRRLRDTVIEACDYFRPDSLKFGLGEAAHGKGGTWEAALDFVMKWAGDLPREIRLLLDAPPGESGTDSLEKAGRILSGGRCRAVLHPFLMSPSELGAALETFGNVIGNLGVQRKQDGKWAGLVDNREESFKIIDAARKRDYKGTWSLEYAYGAGERGENSDSLFDHAEDDLNFLLGAFATGVPPASHKKKK